MPGVEKNKLFWHNISVPEPGPVEPPVIDSTMVDLPVPDTDASALPAKPLEVGGPSGPDPTRFGDWERRGRCIDF